MIMTLTSRHTARPHSIQELIINITIVYSQDNTSGDVYYFNFANGESTWDHPCDKYYQKLLQEEKAKRGKGTGRVTKKLEKPVALAALPAKVLEHLWVWVCKKS
jgi:hypothetical protein